jgi:ParB-like chromosome segregation protein Spo0J
MIKLSTIKSNPNNPRVIKDHKFEKLKKSIDEFPKMMELRPLVINEDNIVLGGNMRLKALKDLGYKEVPEEWVKSAKDLTEDEQRRFIIADNVGFGEHDWEMLANEWDMQELEDWGLDGFPFEAAEETKEQEDKQIEKCEMCGKDI